MPEQRFLQKRQVAYKVVISEITKTNFIKDNISSGYVVLDDRKISRVNIIAIVVYKTEKPNGYSSVVIDDGTGKLLLRSFENNNHLTKANIGDVILVIGRLREFNNERYIIPEILKITGIVWLNLRRCELNRLNIGNVFNENAETADVLVKDNTNDISEEIYALIKLLDTGDGVVVENIVKSSNHPDVESVVSRLLKNGNIFEIKHGVLKVLE